MGVKMVQEAMSRNRFSEILHILHVADNNELDQNRNDWLFKLRPLITQLNVPHQKLFIPTQAQSIDEAMIYSKDMVL